MSAVFEPTRHKLSIDDYVRLSEAGILAPDARVELIEGDLIEMPPIGPGHASVSARLNRLLVRGAGDDAIVSTANPLRLPPRSMPEPDFMLLRPRADDYATEHPDSDDLLLAIEVADTSLRYDREVKARLYASHGVSEYWIVEVGARRLHMHRDPQSSRGTYGTVLAHDAPFRIAPAALPNLLVDSEQIWPPSAA